MEPDKEVISRASDRNIGAYLRLLEEAGVAVIDGELGYVECPGAHLHSTPTHAGHCTLYHNDGWFHFHCFHQSCAEERQRASEALRVAASGAPMAGAARSPEEIAIRQKRQRALEEAEAELLRIVLGQFAWPALAIESDKRGRVVMPLEDQWLAILCLFDPNDVVWIGRDLADTGKPGHQWRFRTRAGWLNCGKHPGPYVCPNSFVSGTHSRSEQYVAKRRFLVVESDELTRDEVGSVFRYLECETGMRLRAVVDTGGKSLHGWFNYPDQKTLKDLRILLRALKCDPQMFGASQPCRLPGSIREETGRPQRLIYCPLD